MNLHTIPTSDARVRWDRRRRRPVSILWEGQRLDVVRLAAVRDERAAYRPARGPRVTYLVDTRGGGHLALVFDALRRRWSVEVAEPAA